MFLYLEFIESSPIFTGSDNIHFINVNNVRHYNNYILNEPINSDSSIFDQI